MSFNLTLTSAVFNASGKFGSSLSGGKGAYLGNGSAPVLPASKTFTVELWAKTTSGGTIIAVGQNTSFWIASAGGKATAHFTSTGGDTAISTNVTINDGAWHHLELNVDSTPIASGGTGAKLFVDGALAGSNATLAGAANPGQYDFGVAQFAGVGGYDWVGEVDEVAVWSTLRHASAFTPPTAPYAGNESGLIALWHLDGNGTDSAGAAAVAATGVTLVGPASGIVSTASSNFTVGVTPVGGTITGTVVVTPNDGGAGGTFSPTTVSLTSASPSGTFTYTPSTTGARTVSVTNNGSLSNPSGIAYTATAAATAPGAPTIGTAVGGNGYVDVAFTAPASNGGAAITSYTATLSTGETATGATSPIRVTAANGTARTAHVTATNSVGPSPASAESNSVTPAAPASTLDTTLVRFSPGSWNVQSGSASTVTPGASFRLVYQYVPGGLTLNFDMTGVTGAVPQLVYRVNGSAWTIVDIAASVVIPAITGSFAHNLLEVVFKSSDGAQGRWSTLGAIVKWVGISGGGTLSKAAARPMVGMYFGDSITEGSNTISNGGTPPFNHAAHVTWAYHSAELLGADAGIVGFGSQGIDVSGLGGVPALTSSYSLLYAGVPRVWPAVLDYVVINMGQNDGSSVGPAKVTSCTNILNGILAAVPSNTKIFVMRPFSGNQAANWVNAIAACSAPSRCIYVDTTGWFNTADSFDTVHPNAYAGQAMGEMLATQIRSGLAGAPTLTARTVTITLGDASGALANITGLKVAFYDEPTPDLHSVPRYKSSTGTTDASGALSFPVQSTLAPGGTGCVVVQMVDGRNLVASVAVA